MDKEKKIWLFEQCAQRMWALAINLTVEAAGIGGTLRRGLPGLAVVAEECRVLSGKIAAYVGEVRFHGGEDEEFEGIADAALQMKLLAVNARLEERRLGQLLDRSDSRSLSVCVEEIRALTEMLLGLSGKSFSSKPRILSETASPLKSTELDDCFFRYSIGGVCLVENVGNVMEVEYVAKTALEGGALNLRGLKVPVIDLYGRFELTHENMDAERQTLMIIYPDRRKKDELYAVPIDDDLNSAIISLRIGYNVPPESGHVFAGFARECWDAVGGGQFVFADWEKLIAND